MTNVTFRGPGRATTPPTPYADVHAAYAVVSDGLYLIDTVRRLAYKSGPGPMGFKPDEFEAAMARPVR